ncbi:cysteine synthase [Vulcanimicrobium alpinum]|uniref:Cysteine synthase n=1 Tax=Vulcanimicrobium alpinum TaxID=3016050 RepID=A0AAN1XVC6_UNVUL|nr:cysteine synthase family protein [Vulcanimicrobium alpinum]BDE06110.1 cysteine synthase [Vulcanimicrobium alpinum]
MDTSCGVAALIGSTKVVAIDAAGGTIAAKAEYLQPGGSVKDRAALAAIVNARRRGTLPPGGTVVEMTSGNMGAGLALVCGAFGHPFVAVMSRGNSPARAAMMRGLGAAVELVAQVDGSPGRVTGADIDAATRRARAIADERCAFFVDQFANADCVLAHETTTGPELRAALPRIDAFVACVGSGATLIGTLRDLKRRDRRVRGVAVEPHGAAVLAGEAVTKAAHLLQGTGYARIPPLWDASLVDAYASVTDEDASAERATLGRMGFYVGFSSAANVLAARRLLASGTLRDGAVVATVLCDTGLKYDPPASG